MERTTTYDDASRLRLVLTQSSSPSLLLNFEMMILGAARSILLEAGVVALGEPGFHQVGHTNRIQLILNEER